MTTPAFYATIDVDSVSKTLHEAMPHDVAYLLPASSWARKGLPAPKLPAHVWNTAADSGGYVATTVWGDYRYTLAEYVAWLHSWEPDPPLWAAMMDYCCEPSIATDRQAVRQRQQKTTAMAYATWRGHDDAPWEWVPTIQGWEVDDYVAHAQELSMLIDAMHYRYAVDSAGDYEFRVGIGTLCSRASVPMIRAIVEAVADVLPYQPKLHLWGVKLDALRVGGWDAPVASVDSAAWNGRFGPAGNDAHKAAGMTQREYGYRVALPAYIAKVSAAVDAAQEAGVQLDLFR